MTKFKKEKNQEELIAVPRSQSNDHPYVEVIGEETIHGAVFKKGTGFKLKHVSPVGDRSYKLLEISNKFKLGDVLLQLPYGIVDKQITGIGATYLELRAPRNSIIVEPLKSIAYTKAREGHLYVGSAIGSQKYDTNIQHIVNYIKDEKVKHKKILVVANSVKKVIDALGDSVYSEYFFMIDEVDSFQADSTFRDRMEICLDYYKKFDERKRCLITATMLPFSDPALLDEKFIQINYKKKIVRTLGLIYTKTLISTIAHEVNELYKNNPGEKIVVAYSFVGDIQKIITLLSKKYSISSVDNKQNIIKVMCGKQNRTTVEKYYDYIVDDKLPGSINFLTSAYFTGVDINENYHCISVSNGNIPFTLLSENKLKQIAGRCRKEKLLSETVIFSCFERSPEPYEKLDIDGLKHIAEVQKAAANCFELQYKEEPILKEELNVLRKSMVDSQTFKGLNFIRVDKNNETAVSYFNIDASFEWTRVKYNLYNHRKSLFKVLKSNGHQVTYKEVDVDLDVKGKNESDDEKVRLAEEAFKNLEEVDIENIREMDDLIFQCGSPIQERIYKYYKSLLPYLERDFITEKIKEFIKQNDSRAYKNFFSSIIFLAKSDSDPIKNDFLNTFKIGKVFTEAEIIKELKKINSKAFIDSALNPAVSPGIKYLNLYFETKIIRDKTVVPEIRSFKIIGLNPLAMKLLRR